MSRKKIPNKTTIKAIKYARIGIGDKEITIDEIIAQKISDDVKNGKEKIYSAKDIFKELGIKH